VLKVLGLNRQSEVSIQHLAESKKRYALILPKSALKWNI